MRIFRCPCSTCGFMSPSPVKALLHVEMFHDLTDRKRTPDDLEWNQSKGYEQSEIEELTEEVSTVTENR